MSKSFEITQYVSRSNKIVGSRIESYILTPGGTKVPDSATMFSEDIVPALREALNNIVIKQA